MTTVSIIEALRVIQESLANARACESGIGWADPEEEAAYHIKKAFVQLQLLLESLKLMQSYESVKELYCTARKEGFSKSESGFEGRFFKWENELRIYIDSIVANYNIYSSGTAFIKDITDVLKRSEYVLGDLAVFQAPPGSEAEVHIRIEAVLKCIFSDLKHKPLLTKSIKNFEPDTGLPSIRTLLEYKFVGSKTDVKRVSDEILADSRGYNSKDYDNVIFVVYETQRFQPQERWDEFLASCGAGEHHKVIVLRGGAIESSKKMKGKRSNAR